MTKHFMRRNSVLWSVIKPNEEIAGCVNYLSEFHYDGCSYPYPDRVSNAFTEILSTKSTMLTANSLVYIFAWRTGIYTLFLLATLLYAFLKKRPLSTLLFLPAIFNALALYIASGWTDYRYFWPIAVMSVFIVPFMSIYVNTEQE